MCLSVKALLGVYYVCLSVKALLGVKIRDKKKVINH